ncbi:MAG: hypothetical protein M2R45_05016 [Verrucomicrobia subdivision 3 bacterium]|nr:hypothetical protein [Limisphaerales bacterium]MCS1417657.1 hypothetical protein [Limisphaerales bacterium]
MERLDLLGLGHFACDWDTGGLVLGGEGLVARLLGAKAGQAAIGFVYVVWIFFRAETLSGAILIVTKIFSLSWSNPAMSLPWLCFFSGGAFIYFRF